MKIRYMIWVIDKLGSAAKGGGLRNGVHDMVNWMLVMNVMQVCSTTFAVLVHKQNLVVRVETDNAVRGGLHEPCGCSKWQEPMHAAMLRGRCDTHRYPDDVA